MKKIVCIFTTCLLIVSCGSEERTMRNVDSELNESVLMNKRVVSQDITLEEISSYYGDEQREIFELLTPENKKRLWEEKFDQLLILAVNEDENLLLNRIYDELKELDFSESLEEDSRERLNDLIAEGISAFEWSDVYVFITFSSFEFYQGEEANYNVLIAVPIVDGGGSSFLTNCNCTWSYGCIVGYDCKEGLNVCKQTTWGCGWFWFDPCIGKCTER